MAEFSDLIRLDSINVVDANIIFAVHATIHPLEHSSILAVRDDHYEDTGNFHSWLIFSVCIINFLSPLTPSRSTAQFPCIVAFQLFGPDLCSQSL